MTDKTKEPLRQPGHAIELNHLIILAREKKKTADFISQLLDLPPAVPADGPVADFFLCIQLANEATILIAEAGEHPPGHYAFKVANSHFNRIVENLKAGKQTFWADPRRQRPFECYEPEGNRGFYVIDPPDHGLEVLTPVNDGAGNPV